MGNKRRRTPSFVTAGIGDGQHVGRENSKQGQGGSHGQIGKLRRPPDDDLIRLAQTARRNSNNNPNNYRLRPARNERLFRIEDEPRRESRWDVMFGSPSTDGNGKLDTGFVNPMRATEPWQLSAFTLVGIVLLLSALFLHLVSDGSGSSSSSSGTQHHHSHRTPKYRRFHDRNNKRKSSGGATRKKKTDEWISDESGTEEEEGASDGQASTSTPKKATGSSNKAVFYSYQPRHRKPSAGGAKETYGATYSPLTAPKQEASGFHSRNYYLTPAHGPVMMPSYHSPSPASQNNKVRLASPSHHPQPLQNIDNNKRSSATKQQNLPPESPLADNSFVVATGLETFQADPPPVPVVAQIQPQQPLEITRPPLGIHGNMEEDDEESQHSSKNVTPRGQTHSPAVSPSLHPCQLSYTHSGSNSYTAYGNFHMDESHHVSNRGSGHTPSRVSSSSNHSSVGMMSPRVEVDIGDLETPRAGMTRKTVDVSLDGQGLNNRGGMLMKQGYQAYSNRAQPRPNSNSSNRSNNIEDPFQILRLPSVPSMGKPQAAGGLNAHHPVEGAQGSQQGQGAFGMPLLPSLDPSNRRPNAWKQEDNLSQTTNGTAAPRSISVEELRLVQMESGSASWQVQDAASGPGAANVQSSSKEPEKVPIVPDLGTSKDLFAFVPSTDDEETDGEFAVETNEARKSIVHKRANITEATDAASSLRSSIKFSELALAEVIGGGGFGQVWRAMWRGTPVAVKVLTGSAQAKHVSKAILEEFAAEINLLSGMRHPNICLYMGACVDPPNRAIITELAANGSLWDALRLPLCPPFQASDGFSRHSWPDHMYTPGKHGAPPTLTAPSIPPVPSVGSWPWVLVKHVACGAARGMAYLHSGDPPILHRDLKSANILLNESYTAKVCDFGLSRLKAQERSMTGNCGTVQWMAPEVLANQRYNEKADVYSYGIICTELLTRECPYEGMTAIQCALAVLNRDQRPELPKWCPPPLKALIKACVKKNPAERPTFTQIIAALDAMP
ncbi:Ephrin type-B receptor 3 (Fragment) [Seminavis robusta]|uniref:Ephrin type-B receptor 3 n=1 Tax=Seminavis robusta TaxID=568900 RepID=A0A9N8ECI5_9STRA